MPKDQLSLLMVLECIEAPEEALSWLETLWDIEWLPIATH